jgi:hypothetical protein
MRTRWREKARSGMLEEPENGEYRGHDGQTSDIGPPSDVYVVYHAHDMPRRDRGRS